MQRKTHLTISQGTRWTIFFVVVLLVLNVPNVKAQEREISDLIITEVDKSTFPNVQIQARVVDQNGAPILGLTNEAFSIVEGETTIGPEVQDHEDGVWVYFVADVGSSIGNSFGAGKTLRWRGIAAAMTDFVQTTPWMQTNLDHVAITAVHASGMESISDGFSTNGPELALAIAGHQLPEADPNLSDVAVALDVALDELNNLEEAEDRPKFIVLLSDYLDKHTGLPEIAARAKDDGIPIYTILTRSGATSEILQQVASTSGGLYAFYDGSASLNSMYRTLTSYRHQYQLSFRSAVGTSGSRQVEVLLDKGLGGSPLSEIASYEVTVDPPRVIIEDPIAGTINRTTDVYTDDPNTVGPTSYTVVASVVFPDNYERRILSAELFNGNRSLGTARNPTGQIQIPWDLRTVRDIGTTTFSLIVETRDEFGIVSRSPAVVVDVNLSIPNAPPTPTTIPLATAIREALDQGGIIIPTPTPTPPCELTDVSCMVDRGTTFAKDEWLSVASLSVAAVAFVFVIANRNKVAPAVANFSTAVRQGVTRLTKRAGPTFPKAYLVVLDGDTNIGRSLAIYGTTRLGRSKDSADLLFQQQDEESVISRLHCTIVDNEDHFRIRDEDSANGTFHNGSRLDPLEEEDLEDGDQIELAQLERGGVRLLFQVADESGASVNTSRTTLLGKSFQSTPTEHREDE